MVWMCQLWISLKLQFHKRFLKHIMHLPDRTADAAVNMPSGQIPNEGEIHKHTLGVLGGFYKK